jgi:peptidoglycan hydrolase-like protein with peptidoglycan-binding domain
MIKQGSQGENVKAWQRFLRRTGFFGGNASGKFGAALLKSTMRFQDEAAVFADGIVGPITTAAAMAEGFEGFTQASDVQGLADLAGIPPEVLQAVKEVESSGDSSATRFEPHVFVRLRPDLRGSIPYTPGKHGAWSNLTKETNRPAFENARKLDPFAAVKATSWGAFQVLGQHLLDEHNGNPKRAVEAFDEDPEGQSAMLLARWFAANPRARAAANAAPPNFHELARCYNGSQYFKHGYHKRLRAAWFKARKK